MVHNEPRVALTIQQYPQRLHRQPGCVSLFGLFGRRVRPLLETTEPIDIMPQSTLASVKATKHMADPEE